jgi:hypothetical protein
MSGDESLPKRRVSLTKRQIAEEQGAKLLSLLCEITADGKLTEDEVKNLGDWLLENQALDYPSVGLLLEVLARVLADGAVSEEERLELHLAIERVLPVTERGKARENRQALEESEEHEHRDPHRDKAADFEKSEKDPFQSADFARRSADWKNDPATEAQRKFIKSLGGTLRPGATKWEASSIIDARLGNQPLSNRQMMVLRFWNRPLRKGEDKRGVVDWLDSFYRDDPDRKLAWELFKQEAEDNGLQGDPSRVPLGIGPNYLARIKRGGKDAIPLFRPESSSGTKGNPSVSVLHVKTIGTWVVLLIIAIIVIFMLITAYSQ